MKEYRKVKKFWQDRARTTKGSIVVTHSDIWQRWLEIEKISKFLKKGQKVLDVGCGNGYTTGTISKKVSRVVGIDYSAEMIERAKKEVKSPNTSFFICDILELSSSKYGMFDLVVSERCLINLKSWQDQKKAIKNIAGVVKPGGTLLFIEGSKRGREGLNMIRESLGLKRMPKVWHNLDFDEKKVGEFFKKYFTVSEQISFGVYDLISRITHPLLVFPKEPVYDSKINKIGAQVANKTNELHSISRVLFLVLKRKND